MDTDPPGPRRGRRPLDPQERRTELTKARLSPIERERLDAYLAERGITESEYLRERIAPAIAAA